jgi:hypothetical protein
MPLREQPKAPLENILETLKFIARLPLAIAAIIVALIFSYVALMLVLKVLVFIIENVIKRPW